MVQEAGKEPLNEVVGEKEAQEVVQVGVKVPTNEVAGGSVGREGVVVVQRGKEVLQTGCHGSHVFAEELGEAEELSSFHHLRLLQPGQSFGHL